MTDAAMRTLVPLVAAYVSTCIRGDWICIVDKLDYDIGDTRR